MTVFDGVLSDIDTLRYAVAGDAADMFAELGITTREQVAERLGIHIDYIPEMPELSAALGPVTVNLVCSGVHEGQLCGLPAVRLAIVGCVHEHINPAWLCAGHDELGFDGDDKSCGPCERLGHKCPLSEITGRTFSEEWLIGSLASSNTRTDEENAELRDFWRANLHLLVPPHLRGA